MEDQTAQLSLWLRMKELGVRKWHAFRAGPHVTDEQVAEEMHKALDRIAAGDCEVVDSLDGDLPTYPIEEFVRAS